MTDPGLNLWFYFILILVTHLVVMFVFRFKSKKIRLRIRTDLQIIKYKTGSFGVLGAATLKILLQEKNDPYSYVTD